MRSLAARLFAFPLPLALAALVLLPSCKQGEGERCQVDADCQDGLLCKKVMGMEDAIFDGVCTPVGSGQDASPGQDAEAEDAEPDAEADASAD